jgi:signal peptidase I
MEPGFHDQNIFFINKILFMFRSPRRFEIVQLFESGKSDVLLMKRVIGLPGETIVVRKNSVFIRDAQGNDTQLEEPYLSPDVITRMPVGRDVVMHVPEDSYLVFGDNRLFSTDSRYYGPVHRRLIVGKLFSF